MSSFSWDSATFSYMAGDSPGKMWWNPARRVMIGRVSRVHGVLRSPSAVGARSAATCRFAGRHGASRCLTRRHDASRRFTTLYDDSRGTGNATTHQRGIATLRDAPAGHRGTYEKPAPILLYGAVARHHGLCCAQTGHHRFCLAPTWHRDRPKGRHDRPWGHWVFTRCHDASRRFTGLHDAPSPRKAKARNGGKAFPHSFLHTMEEASNDPPEGVDGG
jgi:hypothetical protein